jgi:hypothetical protein
MTHWNQWDLLRPGIPASGSIRDAEFSSAQPTNSGNTLISRGLHREETAVADVN